MNTRKNSRTRSTITYLGLTGLEAAVSQPFIKDCLEFVKTAATTAVPFVMAEKYLAGQGDYPLLRTGVQMTTAAVGLPELVNDVGNFLPANQVQASYMAFSAKLQPYASLVGAGGVVLRNLRNTLRQGY